MFYTKSQLGTFQYCFDLYISPIQGLQTVQNYTSAHL